MKDQLLAVAKATDDRLEQTGTRPEPMYGIITMVVASNGGEMEEDLLSLCSRILLAAAQQANCVGRQAIYEFVADTLIRAVNVP